MADLLAYNRWNGWLGGLLCEQHVDIWESEGLDWYLGGCGYYDFWNAEKGNLPWVAKSTQDYKVYGVAAIIGLTYNINRSNFILAFIGNPQ